MATDSSNSIEKMYTDWASERQNRLDAARRCAILTIPSLFPPEGTNDTTDIPLTYDSTAATGVSALSAKITDAVFPPNGLPMFSLMPERSKVPPGTDITEAQNRLNDVVRQVTDRMNRTNLRSTFTDSNEKMLVGGTDLIWFHDDFTFSTHSLEDFVVRRKPNGKVQAFVLREWVDPENLPDDWNDIPAPQSHSSCKAEACYTHVDRSGKVWNVRKEFRKNTVSVGSYKYQPFVFNDWRLIPKSHYARSYIEDIEGDIRMLEVLGKSLKEGAIINSKLLMGIDPSGITEIQDVEFTENGQFIPARKDDIFPIQATSPQQLSTIQASLQTYRRDVGKKFLDATSIQRNGERVTATEWSIMLRQMTGTLTPTFSSKAEEVQLPIIRRFIALMADAGELDPKMLEMTEPGNFLTLQIRTGLMSLQQEVEAAELEEYLAITGGNPITVGEVDGAGWLSRYIAAKRWDPTGLRKTAEQKQLEMQQAMAAQAAQRGIDAFGKIAETGAANATRQ